MERQPDRSQHEGSRSDGVPPAQPAPSSPSPSSPSPSSPSPSSPGLRTRMRRWLSDEFGFVVVIAIVVVAVVYLALAGDHWRRGVGLFTAALFVAAVFRAMLPEAHVGSLGVRGRWRDTVAYLVLGGVILAAAIRLH